MKTNLLEQMTIKCDLIRTYSKEQCLKIAKAIDEKRLYDAFETIPDNAFGKVLEPLDVDWYDATMEYTTVYGGIYFIPREFIQGMYIKQGQPYFFYCKVRRVDCFRRVNLSSCKLPVQQTGKYQSRSRLPV